MFTLSRLSLFTLGVGIVSGLVYAFAASSEIGGPLLVYLPTFPLLTLGFVYGARSNFRASIIALAVVWIATDAGNALFFTFFTALPAYYFLYKTHLYRDEGLAREWYPVTTTLSELSLVAGLVFLVSAVMASQWDHYTLQTLLSREMAADTTVAGNPDVQNALHWLAGEGSFLLFAALAWVWIIMLYIFACLAHNMVAPHGYALRYSLGLSPRGLPVWLLGLASINAGVALFAHGQNRFTGETVFLILLLPYFLAGLAGVHQMAQRSPYKPLALSIFYILLILQPWLGIFVSAYGLLGQIAEILDKRQTIG